MPYTWSCGFVKEGLPFARDLHLENSADSYLYFRLALLHSVCYFFFLYRSPSLLCTVSTSILSNKDEVLSINTSARVFVFGDYNVHHKDWLTYYGLTDRPGELCYSFSISSNLTQIINFPIQILAVILTVFLFRVSFFLLTLVFIVQWLSLHWLILIMLLSQFPLTFQ